MNPFVWINNLGSQIIKKYTIALEQKSDKNNYPNLKALLNISLKEGLSQAQNNINWLSLVQIANADKVQIDGQNFKFSLQQLDINTK